MLMRVLAFLFAASLLQWSPVSAHSKPLPSKHQRPGSRWEVISVDQHRAPKRSKTPAATLFMGADGSVGGTWECNGGGSPYVRWTEAGEFSGTSGPIIFTAAGCREHDETDFAGKFWALFGKAQTWQRNGDVMLIHASDGRSARLRLMSERP
jgi:heat shock protein HslJ